MGAGAVSNLYYPNSNASFRLTITTGLIQMAEGAGDPYSMSSGRIFRGGFCTRTQPTASTPRPLQKRRLGDNSNNPKAPRRPRNRGGHTQSKEELTYVI